MLRRHILVCLCISWICLDILLVYFSYMFYIIGICLVRTIRYPKTKYAGKQSRRGWHGFQEAGQMEGKGSEEGRGAQRKRNIVKKK